MDAEERLRGYRRYVYEAGAVDRSEYGQRKVIGEMVVEKERKKEFIINKVDRFRYRTRYFTDSGIIGSKEFVSKTYMRFKHVFNSKNDKMPKAIKGLSGVYSLKRLSEVVWKKVLSNLFVSNFRAPYFHESKNLQERLIFII